MIEYVFLLFCGVILGIITGLLPGLHVNTIGFMLLVMAPNLNPISFAVVLCSMATTHTFLDFIPSIFLGVPEESTVMSLLPTHRLVVEGKSMEAVKITGIASLYGVFGSVLIMVPAFLVVPLIYDYLREIIVYILIFAVVALLSKERGGNVIWALFIFFLSGYYGFVCLNNQILSSHQTFFPMFSGLFGLSTLILGFSAGSRSYAQNKEADVKLKDRRLLRYSFLGCFGGLLVGLLPAMSPSQIAILFGRIETDMKTGLRKFITIVASLNTSDAIFSIFALYLIGNPRSGASVILKDIFGVITLELMLTFIVVICCSGIISYFIHLRIGSLFASLAGRIDFQKLCACAFVFVAVLVFVFTGFIGLFIAATGMVVGLIPALVGVSRTHSMGVLLLPTIIWFLELS